MAASQVLFSSSSLIHVHVTNGLVRFLQATLTPIESGQSLAMSYSYSHGSSPSAGASSTSTAPGTQLPEYKSKHAITRADPNLALQEGEPSMLKERVSL